MRGKLRHDSAVLIVHLFVFAVHGEHNCLRRLAIAQLLDMGHAERFALWLEQDLADLPALADLGLAFGIARVALVVDRRQRLDSGLDPRATTF